MGVDAGDFDNDGDEDLFVTELTGQGSDLYVNDGSGVFVDAERAHRGSGSPTLPFTGFGAAWFDFDNDGWLDVLTVNGAVTSDRGADASANDPFPLRQRKQLLRNLGNGQFEDVTGRAGAVFQQATRGRGAAFGDIDNDGDTDVVVAQRQRPRRAAHQSGRQPSPLARFAPQSAENVPRDMLGARVEILRTGAPALWRRARCGWQLRVGQRPARPRGTGGFHGSASRARPLAGWKGRRVGRNGNRSIRDVDRRHGQVTTTTTKTRRHEDQDSSSCLRAFVVVVGVALAVAVAACTSRPDTSAGDAPAVAKPADRQALRGLTLPISLGRRRQFNSSFGMHTPH